MVATFLLMRFIKVSTLTWFAEAIELAAVFLLNGLHFYYWIYNRILKCMIDLDIMAFAIVDQNK